ncbi:MAG: lipoyl synthase [Nitrospirota bacterium]|nr:lipoyl synthase [Nitrospirota bacterium]
MPVRLPEWVVRKKTTRGDIRRVKTLLREHNLNTVCESARCPNIGECFSRPTATFMILGDHCTRACGFCAVDKGLPVAVDMEEANRIVQAATAMKLSHVVITSVTRDDLPDGGASLFADVVNKLREALPDALVEVLTPDFGGNRDALEVVLAAKPHIFNHNLETVPRLYEKVRPQADYRRSLQVLKEAKAMAPDRHTKSGIMAGLGETQNEVIAVLRDLKDADCDMVTIGQYLQPSRRHLPVIEYVRPEVFEEYRRIGEEIGFALVASAPLVRSSFNAAEAGKILHKTL